MKKKNKFTSISIPYSIYEKVQKEIEGTCFPSVSSFAAYLLREYLIEKLKGKKPKKDFRIDKKSEEKIKERLRSLGYLD